MDGDTPYRPLPVIDLDGGLEDPLHLPQALCARWREICETMGFLCLINHGLSWQLVGEMLAAARRFHELPPAQKLAIRVNRHQRGFIPSRAGSAHDGRPRPTVSEVLVLATDFPPDHPGVLAGRQFYGSNQWPTQLPGFRETAECYMAAMTALGKSLLPVWATALELDSRYFLPYFVDGYTYFRMIHYPPRNGNIDGALGSNAHVDAGFMTLLPAPEVEGLQVEDMDGNWFNPVVPERSIIVNTGQFLSRWSNDRFRATRHRVIGPAGTSRYSLPCFVNPAFEAETVCLPTCHGPGDPPRHAPGTYLDFFAAYMQRTYSHYDTRAEQASGL